MKIPTFVALALLPIAGVSQAFALSPHDVAEASRILDKVTKIAKDTQILTPGAEIEAPEPRSDNKGRYLSPYRSDGSLTEWAGRGVNAAAGSIVAGEAADRASDHVVGQLAGKVPGGALVGGLFKKKAKQKAQEVGAVAAMGGWDFIRESSDISFDSPDQLAVYMHATHSSADADFAKALAASFGAFPDLKETYEPAVRNAYAQAASRAPKVETVQAVPVVAPTEPADVAAEESPTEPAEAGGIKETIAETPPPTP